ncbi:MAG: lipoprotein-releasing system permease protein [Elusimicrobia bacterium]|nr:MAG: lipoprotein-releasing system permease protein [Elusimicrobiota bacterium]
MFELFIARRYLKAQRKGVFTALTTLIGVAGVSIGVAALLTTLSVMNGFQADIRRKVVGAQSHLTIAASMDPARRAGRKPKPPWTPAPPSSPAPPSPSARPS